MPAASKRETVTEPAKAPPIPPETGPLRAPPAVRERITKEQAEERFGRQSGMAWDEDTQEFVPLAQLVLQERLDRPLDLEAELTRFKRNRDILLRFIRDYLEEAEYDAKGYLVAGKLNDYYHVPGTPPDAKALTKRGGSKLAQLFRWRRGTPEVVQAQATAEHVGVTVKVPMYDHHGIIAGAGLSACSTAEHGFQTKGARKKYGAWYDRDDKESKAPDYRAALNDVVARAGKRAFVQAVIVAAAAEEVFSVATEDEAPPSESKAPGDEAPPTPSKTGPRFPEKFGSVGGKLVSEVPPDKLQKILLWCRESAADKGWMPAALQPIVDAIENELAKVVVPEQDDLPF